MPRVLTRPYFLVLFALCFAAATGIPGTAAAASAATLSDSQIRDILIERIDAQHQSVGIVIGIIAPERTSVVSYGNAGGKNARPLDGDTIFEIGSVTKVFTALTLSDMIQRGELALDDPASKCLPSGSTLPERGGKQITFADLATHTSALPPQLPPTFRQASSGTRDIVKFFYRVLGVYDLPRGIGETYEYSSLGYMLLGQLLAGCADEDFDEILQQRITAPLGLGDTVLTLSREQKSRSATGHNSTLVPVPGMGTAILPGGGGLYSTANDLMKFLSAAMGRSETPLNPAMNAMLEVRRPVAPDVEIALGWHIQEAGRMGDLISHGGTTTGFRAFVGYVPKTGVGVVALSNSSTQVGVDDIGYHILAGVPLQAPPSPRQEVTLDDAVKQRYLGNYELAPKVLLTVSRKDERLFLTMTGYDKMEMFAETETEFFLKDVAAQVIFEVDDKGQPTTLTVYRAEGTFPAKRMK